MSEAYSVLENAAANVLLRGDLPICRLTCTPPWFFVDLRAQNPKQKKRPMEVY